MEPEGCRCTVLGVSLSPRVRAAGNGTGERVWGCASRDPVLQRVGRWRVPAHVQTARRRAKCECVRVLSRVTRGVKDRFRFSIQKNDATRRLLCSGVTPYPRQLICAQPGGARVITTSAPFGRRSIGREQRFRRCCCSCASSRSSHPRCVSQCALAMRMSLRISRGARPRRSAGTSVARRPTVDDAGAATLMEQEQQLLRASRAARIDAASQRGSIHSFQTPHRLILRADSLLWWPAGRWRPTTEAGAEPGMEQKALRVARDGAHDAAS